MPFFGYRLAIVVIVACFIAPTGALGSTKIVYTTTGPVQGKTKLSGISEFLGIPFAEPPLGALRFENPQPITPWSKTKQVTKRGPSCPQLDLYKQLYIGHEDCLKLDLYAPTEPSSKEPLPVLVWIYGGGWVMGDKYEFGLYEPSNLLRDKDIIFVAINYRLNALGFLALDSLSNSGNQGLLDQVMGMQWVKDNIAVFGGDPSRITLAGESAGAFSVCWHMASPVSKGLISAAIIESGTCDASQFFRSRNNSVSFSRAIAQGHGCKGNDAELLACLKNTPVDSLISFAVSLAKYHDTNFIPSLYPVMPWAATYDTPALPSTPLSIISQGEASNKVPLLIGTNKNEGNLFTWFFPANFREIIWTIFGKFFPDIEQRKKITEFYNITESSRTLKNTISQIVTDCFFTCATRRAIRAVQHQGLTVHQYQFDFPGGVLERAIGDAHGFEVPFVFGNFLGPFEEEMSDKFHQYWNNFIRFHNPNGDLAAQENTKPLNWPPYGQNESYMQMNEPLNVLHSLRTSVCDFWDALAEN